MTCLSSTNITFYPGQKFPPIFAPDFENKPVLTRVYLERRVYHDTDEHENENLVTYMEHILDINKCTSIEAHLSHHLSAYGRLSIYNPEYQLSLIIYVEKLTCPAGFLLSQLKRVCVRD